MTLYICDETKKIEKTYEYSVGVNWSNRGEQIKWCQDNFTKDTWCYYDHHGAIYFEFEKDMMWFKLRWAK